MAMTATTDSDLHPCACGAPDCDEMVGPRSKYARGHWAKMQKQNRGLKILPGPDELDDDDLPDELQAELDDLDVPEWLAAIPDAPRGPEGEPDEIRPDPPPSRLRAPSSGGSGKRGPRVTVTIRRDVEAKIRMITVPLGQLVWAPRDPICGGTFVQQEPAIASALAGIVCDSPDLLNFFTGPGGKYMKYFELFMAVMPVGMAVVSHHVAHGQRLPENPLQPEQQPSYAA